MANTWTTLLDAVYPVGAVYQSWSSTSPATLFGGTWTQINVFFLRSCETGEEAGETGGAVSKIFTIDASQSRAVIGASGDNTIVLSYKAWDVLDSRFKTVESYTIFGQSSTTNERSFNHHVPIYGQTEEASIMPPYVTCYTWRRTA